MKLSDIKTFPARVRGKGHTDIWTVYYCDTGKDYPYIVWRDGDSDPMGTTDSYDNWELITPKKVLHKYLMKPIDMHQPVRPTLTLHFDTVEGAEYYANQHSYATVAYLGEVEVDAK